MKRVFRSLFLLNLGLLLFGFTACKQEFGSLSVQITGKTAVNAGEVIQFKGIAPEKVDLKEATVYLYDADGQQIDSRLLNPKGLTYKYKFDIAGKYRLEYFVKSDDNYGSSFADIKVTYKGWTPSWRLSDDPANPISIKALSEVTGEYPLTTFYLNKLTENKAVQSVDVKLIRSDDVNGDQVLYYEKSIKNGSFQWKPETGKFGTIRLVAYLNMKDGNTNQVEDLFTVLDPQNPVNVTITATNVDHRYPDKIRIRGTATYGDGSPIIEMKIIRICTYGKESGCEPLAQPHCDPNDSAKFYNKANDPFPQYTVEYPLVFLEDGVTPDPNCPIQYDPMTGVFEFEDPMPYFNEKGEVESEGFKWDYAKVDREAWKAILRKKNFNLERAFGVQYIVEAKGDKDKPSVKSVKATGLPYLSTVPMAQFCLWAKEVAMNRLWHMQVPRWCYSKSMSWLSKGQTVTSNDGQGQIGYSAGLSGGSGYINNYSDWPDIRVYTNKSIGVSGLDTSTNVRRSHALEYTVVTPIWGQTQVKMDLGVRDYVLQWGLYLDNAKAPATGWLNLYREGNEEKLDAKALRAFMPLYNAAEWSPIKGYGYEQWDAGPGDPKKAWGEVATWTKVNFKYPPTPGSSEYGFWHDKEGDWSIKYEVTE